MDIAEKARQLPIPGAKRRPMQGMRRRRDSDLFESYRETSRGEFSRSISLPAHVDGSKAKAKYADGVLELTLPKVQGSKRLKINISAQ